MLFINDEECYLNYYSEFNATVDLKEGDNRFTFRAVNNDGKEVSETRVITYTPEKVEEEMPTEYSNTRADKILFYLLFYLCEIIKCRT